MFKEISPKKKKETRIKEIKTLLCLTLSVALFTNIYLSKIKQIRELFYSHGRYRG